MAALPRPPSQDDRARPLCIVLRPSAHDADLLSALRCLKRLVPRARVVVAPACPPPGDGEAEIIALDAAEVAAGPLAAATALERERRKRRVT
jgi:hypothetical protein